MNPPSVAAGDQGDASRLVTPVFLRVALATFAYFVSIGALIPTLPLYVKGPLEGGSVAVGLTIGAFSLAAVLFRPFVGRLGDARGRRLLIVAGGLFSAASAAAYLLASALVSLVLLRLVAGVGEAFLYVGAASAINDLAPEDRRGEAFSYFSLALYAGLTLGPILGEWTLGWSGYDAVWVLSAASSFVAMFVGLGVPDTRPPLSAEAVEMASAPAPARSGGEASDAGGDRSPTRSARPTASFAPRRSRYLVHRAGLLPGVVLATAIWGLGGFNTFVPLYALTLGLSGSRMVFALFSLVVMSIRSFGARIPDRVGPRRAARTALAFSATGLALIGAWAAPPGLFAGTVLLAVGQALAFPALITLAVRGAPASERGAVVGTFTAFFDLAFGLGALGLGGVVAVLGYPGLFFTSAAVAAIGVVLLLVTGRGEEAERATESARQA